MWLLLSPLSWVLAALAMLAWGQRPALRLLAALVLGAALVLMTPLGANALVAWIEQGLHQPPACAADHKAPVLLLMGGLQAQPTGPQQVSALNAESLERVLAVVAVDQVEVLVSGGYGGTVTEADLGAQLLRMLGTAPGRLRLDRVSRSTWDSAAWVATQPGVAAQGVQLLTSALHVPRAALALQRHGVAVCAIRLRSNHVPLAGLGYFVPQASALVKAQRSLHELLGTLAYRFRSSAVGLPQKGAP